MCISLSNEIMGEWFSNLKPSFSTSVTAGAVVRPLISTLLAGVVTEMALPPCGITPLLTVEVTESIIKEPAGQCVVSSVFVYMILYTQDNLKMFNLNLIHEFLVIIHFLTVCGLLALEYSKCTSSAVLLCIFWIEMFAWQWFSPWFRAAGAVLSLRTRALHTGSVTQVAFSMWTQVFSCERREQQWTNMTSHLPRKKKTLIS